MIVEIEVIHPARAPICSRCPSTNIQNATLRVIGRRGMHTRHLHVCLAHLTNAVMDVFAWEPAA